MTAQLLQAAATPACLQEAGCPTIQGHAASDADVEGGYDHNWVLHDLGKQAKFKVKGQVGSETWVLPCI